MSYDEEGEDDLAIAHYQSIVGRTYYEGRNFAPQSRTIGDSYHNLINLLRTQSAEALTTLLGGVDADTLLENFRKMGIKEHGYGALYYDYGEQQYDTAIMNLVLQELQDAMAAYEAETPPDPRGYNNAAYAYNTIANIHRRRADNSSGIERETYAGLALVALQKVIDDYPSANGYRTSASARSTIVGLYLWTLDDVDTAEAKAREYAAIVYPAGSYPGAAAMIANRLGMVLSRRGWDARDDGGYDYQS